MAGGLDEEQAAVDTGILDITLTLRGELLAEVCRVLVLDVLDDGVPASVVSVYLSMCGVQDDCRVIRTIGRCSPGHRNPECPRCSDGDGRRSPR